MKTACLFSGQATDIGDSVDTWRRASSHVEQLLECAASAAGVSVEEMVRLAALRRTSVFQPVITALSIGIYRSQQDAVTPDFVAGHSVGEIAACAVAGAIDDRDAVRLAATRGALMERQAALHPGGMIAVRGDEADVQAAIALGSASGQVGLAAHNAPDEWVLSGDTAALRAIASKVQVAPLDTPGPWHSAAMADAIEPYSAALRDVIRSAPAIPVVFNRTGEVQIPRSARDDMVGILAGQMTKPVQWARTMQTLHDEGVTRMIICGPGKSLRRFAGTGMSVTVLAHPMVHSQ